MRTSFAVLSVTAVAMLAACEPSIPDSGAGFRDYNTVNTNTQQALQGSPIQSGVISDETAGPTSISAAIEQAVNQTPALMDSDPNRPRSAAIAGIQSTSSISDTQDFDAVKSRSTIESDAQRLANNRAQYVEVAPTALPTRSGSSGNTTIVAYALQTNNSLGQQIYSRSKNSSESKFKKVCSKFGSSDQAQQAFLDAGGPQKDRKGMDPDGDGFACYWDPAPFRAARGG